MTTIDKLDISVYSMYALRITMIEQINNQLRLTEASTIPPQTQMVDIWPKLTEMDLLLGVVPLATPWAYFYPPKRFFSLRRSPFSFRVGPSFGSLDREEEFEALLVTVPVTTPEEISEKATIKNLLEKMRYINDMISFITGRIGQFLQG